MEQGTTSRDNVATYVKDHNLPVTFQEFASFEELRYAFVTGRCDLYTSDRSFLVEFRNSEMPSPDDYLILDDVVSKEPLAAAVTERLEAGEQSLLFLNRRGYAPLTICRACGQQVGWDGCDGRMVENWVRGGEVSGGGLTCPGG